jgi:RNA polymerase sigma-70 factor, ECF subfamily
MNDQLNFNQYRPYLFSIAYRMLGTVMDAEDMVQDTYLRWQNTDRSAVESPQAYLATMITRRSIDFLRSAKVQREQYIGPWLPEPLLTDTAQSSESAAALSDSLSIAFLHLLEKLSPVERAVFLLREVFDYGYTEIAQIVEKSDANCRQVFRRAKQHLQQESPRFESSPDEQQEIMAAFAQACVQGDLSGLMALLAEDVVEWSDGGGQTYAALNPIYGADKVARFFLAIMKQAPSDYVPVFTAVNGQAGMVAYVNGRPVYVMVLDVFNGRIQNIYNILNPDKLKNLPLSPDAGTEDGINGPG